MTQENKELLLKELSSRYPYEVILHFDDKVEQDDEPLYNIRKNGGKYLINDAYYLEEVKPYLRSMKSMTSDEWLEYLSLKESIVAADGITYNFETFESIDWLITHHFDYNDLIEKGLAIEAPEEIYN